MILLLTPSLRRSKICVEAERITHYTYVDYTKTTITTSFYNTERQLSPKLPGFIRTSSSLLMSQLNVSCTCNKVNRKTKVGEASPYSLSFSLRVLFHSAITSRNNLFSHIALIQLERWLYTGFKMNNILV